MKKNLSYMFFCTTRNSKHELAMKHLSPFIPSSSIWRSGQEFFTAEVSKNTSGDLVRRLNTTHNTHCKKATKPTPHQRLILSNPKTRAECSKRTTLGTAGDASSETNIFQSIWRFEETISWQKWAKNTRSIEITSYFVQKIYEERSDTKLLSYR